MIFKPKNVQNLANTEACTYSRDIHIEVTLVSDTWSLSVPFVPSFLIF